MLYVVPDYLRVEYDERSLLYTCRYSCQGAFVIMRADYEPG
ncbi:hypothetical protein SELR_pSRC101940 (plasmid) [Selenomonas ruminantium subsp. lactilytica TAM6421]|uniref:Uncharacterized protein n=1 Tax=Selenomonas ruminantium subsp. lactilytica (strain NBRC 103574 / TAM6421) TaxID=927704 RepID=I0GW64_SELRL|nr:hypothetical protein SELR_pSRC101940 [Selenomonas ruminantium subsp. lactilytica TAM6421]